MSDLSLTRVFFAGTLVSEPIIRPGQDGDVAVLKIKVTGPEDRLEWVRAEGDLGRFVAESRFAEGDAVLVLGELGSRTSTDRRGHERAGFFTLAHRLSHDECARWVDRP